MKHVSLHLDDGLAAQVAAAAKADGRSVNGFLTWMIRMTLRDVPRPAVPPTESANRADIFKGRK